MPKRVKGKNKGNTTATDAEEITDKMGKLSTAELTKGDKKQNKVSIYIQHNIVKHTGFIRMFNTYVLFVVHRTGGGGGGGGS